jgi:DNA-binding transcriptional LysR family regulator
MDISWDDHRFFLAIARAGTLTAAASMLSVSQPTVSRRLEAFERKLGARLFNRTRKGYELTAGGAELFETVARVEEELAEADRGVFGRDQSISGLLRFTSTETFVSGYLGQHVWEFLQENGEVEIQLICTDSTLSLGRGEADLAIRFTENPPETLIGRRLGTVAYAIYAAAGSAGDRFSRGERSRWEWIGMHTESFNRMIFGTFSPSSRLKHRVDSVSAMRAMVAAGLGMSILPCYIADPDPGLRRIDPDPLIDSRFDMWVLYHPNARRTRRLRVFAEFVTDRIRSDLDLFEGRLGALRSTYSPVGNIGDIWCVEE